MRRSHLREPLSPLRPGWHLWQPRKGSEEGKGRLKRDRMSTTAVIFQTEDHHGLATTSVNGGLGLVFGTPSALRRCGERIASPGESALDLRQMSLPMNPRPRLAQGER